MQGVDSCRTLPVGTPVVGGFRGLGPAPIVGAGLNTSCKAQRVLGNCCSRPNPCPLRSHSVAALRVAREIWQSPGALGIRAV